MSELSQFQRCLMEAEANRVRITRWKLSTVAAHRLADDLSFKIGRSPVGLYEAMVRGEAHIFGAKLQVIDQFGATIAA